MALLSIRENYREALILVAVTLICLVPFLSKAFHIDDPLFIWSAKQIVKNPADFYGFDVNWYGTEQPMTEVMHNPPLTCYYISAVGLLFGWSETALHTAFIVPALIAAIGTYYLAKELCSQPMPATLAAVLTPAFLVSGTNIMCDMMMAAFWVYALFFWIKGIKANKQWMLFLSAILAGVCVLTKFSGIILLGLFFAYSIMRTRKFGIWTVYLLIPVILILLYQLITRHLYGQDLVSGASIRALGSEQFGKTRLHLKMLTGLAFMGGGIITVLFYTPLIWRRGVLICGLSAVSFLMLVLVSAEKTGTTAVRSDGGINWGFVIQAILMTGGGVSLLALAGTDFWKYRDAESLLLLVWVFGTYIFASFITWTINVRYLLPIAPGAGILLMRRINRSGKIGQSLGFWRFSWPLLPAAVISISVSWADYTLANTARSAATTIDGRYKSYEGTVWFQGHWGFQYYMENNGHKAHDIEDNTSVEGDVLVIPVNNYKTWLSAVQAKGIRPISTFEFVCCRWLATMSRKSGAGFYIDGSGVLPYTLGPVDLERYYVFAVR